MIELYYMETEMTQVILGHLTYVEKKIPIWIIFTAS